VTKHARDLHHDASESETAQLKATGWGIYYGPHLRRYLQFRDTVGYGLNGFIIRLKGQGMLPDQVEVDGSPIGRPRATNGRSYIASSQFPGSTKVALVTPLQFHSSIEPVKAWMIFCLSL
jgi:hypothetical protein